MAPGLVSDLLQAGQLLWRERGRLPLDLEQGFAGRRRHRARPVGFGRAVRLDLAVEPDGRLRRHRRSPVRRGFRMPPDLEAKLAAWIERQPEPRPSRSEAIRRLLENALKNAS